MNRLKKSQSTEYAQIPNVSTLVSEQESMGQIKINHSVVASIVRLATLEVEGVYAVGGGFVDGIAEIFSKKDSDRGVHVEEDEIGHYNIDVRVTLKFGSELAKVGMAIQENVSKKVTVMTMKDVSHVNVIIDGVKMCKAQASGHEEDWEEAHTD